MFLKNIKLVNFRNYDNLFLDLSPGINIIYGENAQGKTNLLESIYFLALTKSHRSINDLNLIKNDCDFSTISTDCTINNVNTNLEISITNKGKRLKQDNNIIKIVSDYVSNIKVIIFFPEDLDLIKSSPDIRRHYINTQISQLDKNYFKILSEYNKLLKIRNNLLKDYLKNNIFDNNYFEIITNYLIDKASSIYYYRNKYINKINSYITNIFLDISSYDDFKIEYKPNFIINSFNINDLKEILKEKFNNIVEIEKKAGTTLVGPHRDDIEFYIKDKNLKQYGSQGQQRMAVLSLKLSEIEIFKKYNNDNPILLLDDVFSELDDNKKNALLKYISNEIQTIITTTELSNLDKKIIKEAKLIHISAGKILEEE